MVGHPLSQSDARIVGSAWPSGVAELVLGYRPKGSVVAIELTPLLGMRERVRQYAFDYTGEPRVYDRFTFPLFVVGKLRVGR